MDLNLKANLDNYVFEDFDTNNHNDKQILNITGLKKQFSNLNPETLLKIKNILSNALDMNIENKDLKCFSVVNDYPIKDDNDNLNGFISTVLLIEFNTLEQKIALSLDDFDYLQI